MKKIMLILGLVAVIATMTVATTACSAASPDPYAYANSGVDGSTEGHWKKLSNSKQQAMQKPIPKKYRGTWYAWNVLKNRKERVKIKARSFEYAYRTKKGRYAVLDRYQGKQLAAWNTKYNHVSVNYILKKKSDGRYKLFNEKFVLHRTKQGVRVTLPPEWIDTLNHNYKVTFRKKMKQPVMGHQKMTKSFLSKTGHLSSYYKKNDVYYTLKFNKGITHMQFDVQSIWNGDGPDVATDLDALMIGGDESTYAKIVSSSFKGNKATFIVLPPASLEDVYYKIQFKRISKQYLVVDKIPKKNEWFNGKKIYRTPSLFGVRFVNSNDI